MSYASRPRPTARVQRASLSGLFTDIFAGIGIGGAQQDLENAACATSANARMGTMDQQIADVESNWNPTGYYSRNQFRDVLRSGSDALSSAGSAIFDAQNDLQLSSHRALLDSAGARLTKQGQQLVDFLGALQSANASNTDIIDSTGVRRWVIDSMKAVRNAQFVSSMVACARPWFLSALQTIGAAMDVFVSVVKAIAGVLLELGKTVLKIPDMVGDLIRIAKWTLLLGGAYFVGVNLDIIPPKYDPLKLKR